MPKVGDVWYEVKAQNDVSSGLAAAAGEVKTFQQYVDSLDATVDVVTRARGTKRTISELKEVQKELSALKKRKELYLKTLDDEGKAYKRVEGEVEDLGDQMKLTSSDIDEQESKMEGLTHALDAHNASLKEYQREQEKAQRLGKQHSAALQENTKREQAWLVMLGKAKAEDIKRDKARAVQQEKAIALNEKQTAGIAKMKLAYADLWTKREKADRTPSFLNGPRQLLEIAAYNEQLDALGDKLHRAGVDTDTLRVRMDKNHNVLGRLSDGLQNVRIQLGFMSIGIRGFAVLMGTLGPLILGIAGAASSLVGVFGAGILGAVATGGAALTGFTLATVGAIMAIKQMPVVMDRAEEGWKALSGRFEQKTKAAQPAVMAALEGGLKAANALLPVFAAETVRTMDVASAATQKWTDALAGEEAKGLLSDTMAGFRHSLPSLMDGFGQLGALMGRVLGSAAGFLPELTSGFEKWATSMTEGLGKGATLDQKIGGIVDHMQQVGHFAQSAGSMMKTFFGAGAEEGGNMLKSMERTFDGWNKWMRSVEGQKSLANFFADSRDLVTDLGSSFVQVAAAFGKLSDVMQPFVDGLVTGIGLLASAFNLLPGAVLNAAGAMYAFRKAAMWITGVNIATGAAPLATRLFGRGGPQQVAKGTQQVSSAAKQAAPQITKWAAASAGGAVAGEAAAKSAGRFSGALSKVGEVAKTFGRGAGGPAAVFLGTVIAGQKLSALMDEQARELSDAEREMVRYSQRISQLPKRQAEFAGALRAARQDLQAYRAEAQRSGKASAESAAAMRQQRRSAAELAATVAPLRSAINAGITVGMGEAARATRNWNQYMASTDTELLSMARSTAFMSGRQAEFEAALQHSGTSVGAVISVMRRFGMQIDTTSSQFGNLKGQVSAFNQTQRSGAADLIASARAIKGLEALSGKAAMAVGKLAQEFGSGLGGKQVRKLLVSTNAPEQLTRIQKLSAKLPKQTVMRIFARGGGDAGKTMDMLEKKRDSIDRKKGTAKLDTKVTGKEKLDNILGQIKKISKDHKARVNVTAELGQFVGPVNAAKEEAAKPISIPVTPFLTTPFPTKGNYSGGMPAYAKGGTPSQKEMARASQRAGSHATMAAGPGQRISRPTFLTGEIGGDTEWVITDNQNWRQSNLNYLSQAAAALGAAVVPAYKKGKGYKGPDSFEYDKPARGKKGKSGKDKLSEQYNYWTDLIEETTGAYTASKRSYDLSGTPPVASLVDILKSQVANYGNLNSVIQQLLNKTPAAKKVKLGKKPKAKNKKARKRWEAIKERNDRAKSFNESREQGFESLDDEYASNLREITSLNYDMLELQNAVNTNTLAGQGALSSAVFDTFKSFSSNIKPFGGSGPGIPGLPSNTPPTPSYVNPSIAATRMAGPAAAEARVGQGVTLNNYFREVPPDPHTWSQQAAFELAVL